MDGRYDPPPNDEWQNNGTSAGGASAGGASAGMNNTLAQVNQEVDRMKQQMHKNLGALNERGTKLEDLQDKTENLATTSHGFNRGAHKMRKQMWWKNVKMRIWIIVGIIVLLLVIIVPSVVASKHT